MCVALIITTDGRPSRADLLKMQCANADGIGYGWAEGGRVHWKKGVTVQQLDDALDTLPRPVFVHFRLATAGGKRAALCHPFPVNADADVRIVGSAGALMMHNGHWSDWDDWYDALKDEKVPLPDGPWSDTRFTAYMMAHWPRELDSIAKLNGGRVALLRSDGTFTTWGDWRTPETTGLIYSNYYWSATSVGYYGNYADWDEADWQRWSDNGEAVVCAATIPTAMSPAQRAIEAEARMTSHRQSYEELRKSRSPSAVTDSGTRYHTNRFPPELEEELTDDEIDALADGEMPEYVRNGYRVPDFDRQRRLTSEEHEAAWEAMVTGYGRE